MTRRRFTRSLVVAALGAWSALTGAVAPAAFAQGPPCPDAEVVFARGTGEAPGVGGVGQAFVDSVRAQAGGRTVGVYAVNYLAANNFQDRIGFANTVIDGIRDEADHIRAMAANCPNTRLILGGYSQGAVVSGFVTAPVVPPGIPAETVPAPLPPEVADHVAAVVLFGTPSPEFLRMYDAPQLQIGALFADKTLQLCAPGDTICENVPNGGPTLAHALYPVNGMVNQGAAYAVGRL
jgi:cutinase